MQEFMLWIGPPKQEAISAGGLCFRRATVLRTAGQLQLLSWKTSLK
jgi:hypothetical protein